ncbi:MAG: hypothetical protein SNI70_12355 [Rikenellaceae bacterium]
MEKKTLMKIITLVIGTYGVAFLLFSRFTDIETYLLSALLFSLCAYTAIFVKYKVGRKKEIRYIKLDDGDITQLSEQMSKVKHIKFDEKDITHISDSMNTAIADMQIKSADASIDHQQTLCTLTGEEVHTRATTLVKLLMPEDGHQHSGELCLKLLMTCNGVVKNITTRDWEIFLEIEKERKEVKRKHSLFSLVDLITEAENKRPSIFSSFNLTE